MCSMRTALCDLCLAVFGFQDLGSEKNPGWEVAGVTRDVGQRATGPPLAWTLQFEGERGNISKQRLAREKQTLSNALPNT